MPAAVFHARERAFCMNNKCCNGCDQGFIPVNANWDFNMDREDCVPRRNGTANTCAREQEAYQPCPRKATCACEEKTGNDCQSRTRTNTCPCEEKKTSECQASNRNIACVREPRNCGGQYRSLPAMVSVEMQELGEIYQAEAALKAGTLFPELHKPMRGCCPQGSLCADACQAEAFMLWDLRLYLSTHPGDKEAMALFRHLCQNCCEPNYATTFLTEESCSGWGWMKNPWPWEYSANAGKCVKEGTNHVCV